MKPEIKKLKHVEFEVLETNEIALTHFEYSHGHKWASGLTLTKSEARALKKFLEEVLG